MAKKVNKARGLRLERLRKRAEKEKETKVDAWIITQASK